MERRILLRPQSFHFKIWYLNYIVLCFNLFFLYLKCAAKHQMAAECSRRTEAE